MSAQTWEPANGESLRRARETKGIDRTTLARRACLSVPQVVQLEEGGVCHFYTAAIKLLAGRRACAVLDSMPDGTLPDLPLHDPTNPSSSSLASGTADSSVGAPGVDP
jgi:hypothetical protein